MILLQNLQREEFVKQLIRKMAPPLGKSNQTFIRILEFH